MSLTGCTGVPQKEMDQLREAYIKPEEENKVLRGELKAAKQRIEEFSELEEMYRDLSQAELEARLAANELQAEKDRQEKERLLAEERARAEAEAIAAAAREAEEKLGYETGITYSQLPRTPNEYRGKKVKFTGKVIQVIDGGYEVNLRVAIIMTGLYSFITLVLLLRFEFSKTTPSPSMVFLRAYTRTHRP